METLQGIWDRHEDELNKYLEELVNIDNNIKHNLRIMQIKHQREELRAYQNDK